MAAAPIYAAAIRNGIARITTANTNRDGTATAPTTCFTAGSSGSKLNRITLKAETDLADSVIILWRQIGGVWYSWKEVDPGDPASGSNTVAAWTYEVPLSDQDINLASGELIGATLTVAPTTGALVVHVFGADY